MAKNVPEIKIVVVGDGTVGKTCEFAARCNVCGMQFCALHFSDLFYPLSLQDLVQIVTNDFKIELREENHWLPVEASCLCQAITGVIMGKAAGMLRAVLVMLQGSFHWI